jgi:hypothetical protein
MRKVSIQGEPRVQRRWVVVDARSGEAVLRLHDRNLLYVVCEKLGWKLVERRLPGQGAFAPRAAG